MGIKLRKRESMEHCDSCGATMSEYEYDRYGGLCKLCRGEESKAHSPDGKPSGIQGNEAVTFTAIRNPEQAAFIIDCGSAEKAKALNDAFDDAAHNENGSLTSKNLGGDPIDWWNAGQFFAARVDPCDKATAWCENWLRNSGPALAIQGNSAGLESKANEGSFTDNFRIQYLDEFDPEFSGKEVMIKGTGTDRRSARADAINKFYDGHPDAEIYAIK